MSLNIATNGCIYLSGRFGGLFLEQKSDCVTLKLRKRVNLQYKTVKWLCFSTKSSKLRIYTWSKRCGIRDITYLNCLGYIHKLLKAAKVKHFEENYLLIESLTKAVTELLGADDPLCLYNLTISTALPFLKQYKHIPIIPTVLRQGFKEESLANAVNVWFATKSKLLIKLVAKELGADPLCNNKELSTNSINLLALAKAFSPHWQVDYIQALLKLKPRCTDYNLAYCLLKNYSPSRVISLLSSMGENGHNEYWLNDTANMYLQLSQSFPDYKLPERPRSIVELHNYVQRDYNRFKSETDAKLKLPTNKLAKLDGLTIDNLTFIVPKLASTLNEWSNALNNCLASYASKVVNKQCYLLGILADGKIRYAIEIDRQGVILQFSGVNNNPPLPEDRAAIGKFLYPKLEELFT